jgi:glycerophosphoryl diester phosphodiesterase
MHTALRATILLTGLALLSGSSFGMEIIAHRGASFDAPENTLAAFKLGFEQGADGVELDIHATREGAIVAIHDSDTGRTSGVTNRIAAASLPELRNLEAGRWGKWRGLGFSERIPLLEEVPPLVPAGRRLFIEIKSGSGLIPELGRILGRSHLEPKQVVIIGFDFETVRQAKQQLPHYEVCWLAGADKKTREYPPLEQLIAKARSARLDGLDLESGFPIDRRFADAVHAAGLKLYTWTVDDPELARRHAEAGVDGLTTNRPGWLRAQLASYPKAPPR